MKILCDKLKKKYYQRCTLDTDPLKGRRRRQRLILKCTRLWKARNVQSDIAFEHYLRRTNDRTICQVIRTLHTCKTIRENKNIVE